jgi:hypothetical protein
MSACPPSDVFDWLLGGCLDPDARARSSTSSSVRCLAAMEHRTRYQALTHRPGPPAANRKPRSFCGCARLPSVLRADPPASGSLFRDRRAGRAVAGDTRLQGAGGTGTGRHGRRLQGPADKPWTDGGGATMLLPEATATLPGWPASSSRGDGGPAAAPNIVQSTRSASIVTGGTGTPTGRAVRTSRWYAPGGSLAGHLAGVGAAPRRRPGGDAGAGGASTPTSRTLSTATSSRLTSCSPPTGPPRSATSASPGASRVGRDSPSPAT